MVTGQSHPEFEEHKYPLLPLEVLTPSLYQLQSQSSSVHYHSILSAFQSCDKFRYKAQPFLPCVNCDLALTIEVG